MIKILKKQQWLNQEIKKAICGNVCVENEAYLYSVFLSCFTINKWKVKSLIKIPKGAPIHRKMIL